MSVCKLKISSNLCSNHADECLRELLAGCRAYRYSIHHAVVRSKCYRYWLITSPIFWVHCLLQQSVHQQQRGRWKSATAAATRGSDESSPAMMTDGAVIGQLRDVEFIALAQRSDVYAGSARMHRCRQWCRSRFPQRLRVLLSFPLCKTMIYGVKVSRFPPLFFALSPSCVGSVTTQMTEQGWR